jgi:NAD(P)-dependent dehydrogenase (short-subunit alcohol dehydrogenase family)
MSFTNRNGTAPLKGRVALVTGAGRGIGRAVALELAHRGADIALNYRVNLAEAESLADQIRECGVDSMLVQGDVASRQQAHDLIQTVLDAWKRLDILVNNAGITRDKSLRKMVDDEWSDVINVNLNGTYYCTSAAIPSMVDQKFGRIINISSYVGQAGSFGQPNYAAGKGGMIAFTKAAAIELAKHNITVNAIAPGFTSTEMLSQIPANVLDQIRAKIPMGRLARPEEIAKAAAFLAVDGDYITGQQLNVNGGIYM